MAKLQKMKYTANILRLKARYLRTFKHKLTYDFKFVISHRHKHHLPALRSAITMRMCS